MMKCNSIPKTYVELQDNKGADGMLRFVPCQLRAVHCTISLVIKLVLNIGLMSITCEGDTGFINWIIYSLDKSII